MRAPLSWLKEFVDLEAEPRIIADRLTAAGMKVERVERLGADISGVVVGEVLEVLPHPGADRLVLVDVRLDSGERRVVCGAKNFVPGDKVPVALPGASVVGHSKFEARKIRGELSDGMLCSAAELGLSDDHSGILILPADAQLGEDVRGVVGLDETVFELEISPNRPDVMSLIGVAREAAASVGTQIRLPHPSLRPGPQSVESLVSIEVEDIQGCPRYLGRVITGVVFGSSPNWAQRRLTAAGIRPISAVVDATNYALLVTGHPLHAFDLDRVTGRKIVVRRARGGEKIVTIDGVTRTLDSDDLVIADAAMPVAIAGVMGGRESEVSETTTRVVLESAYFDPRSIYRSSRRHGLRSEASSRFERGADPNGVGFAADLACSLIVEWAGGEVASGEIDVYPSVIANSPVTLRPQRAREILGAEFSDEEMFGALDRLGLKPEVKGELIEVTPPTFRNDLKVEEDLIEEVARVLGYDRIPLTLPSGRHRAGVLASKDRLVRKVRRTLAGAGLYEVWSSGLIGPQDLDLAGNPSVVSLSNPLNQEQSLLRPSLLPGLVAAVVRNFARRNLEVRLFEVGRCFLPSGKLLPNEPLLAGFALGGVTTQRWDEPARELDLFDVKGVAEVLLRSLRISATFDEIVQPPFHPLRAASISVDSEQVGIIGELSPEIIQRLDVPYRIVVGEFALDRLLDLKGRSESAEETGKYPAVLIDIAISVPEAARAGDITDTAISAGGEILEGIRLIDLYRGEQVGVGQKSLAFSLSFRRPDRTLTEKEALKARDAIFDALVRMHDATPRS